MTAASGRHLLVIVAKAPLPGTVKTRLLTRLTPREATDLYSCFIRDRVREFSRLKGMDLAIAYTPASEEPYFARFLTNGFKLFAQQGRDLGERLHQVFTQNLGLGYEAVAIIDSDTPDLPRATVVQAFEWLSAESADAVFGPCKDGGYYLVGLRRPRSELFDDIPWSTPQVLSETLRKAETLGLNVRLLPEWNDLDTFEDLLAFYRKYRDTAPGGSLVGRETFDYLTRLALTER